MVPPPSDLRDSLILGGIHLSLTSSFNRSVLGAGQGDTHIILAFGRLRREDGCQTLSQKKPKAPHKGLCCGFTSSWAWGEGRRILTFTPKPGGGDEETPCLESEMLHSCWGSYLQRKDVKGMIKRSKHFSCCQPCVAPHVLRRALTTSLGDLLLQSLFEKEFLHLLLIFAAAFTVFKQVALFCCL